MALQDNDTQNIAMGVIKNGEQEICVILVHMYNVEQMQGVG